MALIKLSRNLTTIVDDENFEHLSRFRWFAVGGKRSPFYAVRYERADLSGIHPFLVKVVRKNGHLPPIAYDLFPSQSQRDQILARILDRRQRWVWMHHEVLPGHRMLDHRNGDGLDNRRENLRPCTVAQNNANRRKSKRGPSQYKGVRPVNGRWQASIGVDGNSIYLGLFESEEAAAHAYDAAARYFHGEFARPNFAEAS